MFQLTSALFDRYPEIAFLLAEGGENSYERIVSPEGWANAMGRKSTSLHRTENIAAEMEEWIKPLSLDAIDVLVVLGIGMGHSYRALKEWLKARPERALVYIEEDLGVLELLARSGDAEDLFADPQVHLKIALDQSDWEHILEEIPLHFPTEKIEMAFLESYYTITKERAEKERLRLLRNAASFTALMADALHTEKLMANLVANFRRLKDCSLANAWAGKLRGMPAIICGAGPSLQASLPLLKEAGDKACIFAGGSTIAALTSQGVEPHLAMAVDPNPEEYFRFKTHNAFAAPFLFCNRLLPDVFATLNGPLSYLKAETGGELESWMDGILNIQEHPIGPELDREAMTVTTLALALAYSLGCDPIICVGVDLAYTGNKRYADGVLPDASISLETMSAAKASEKPMERIDRLGNPILTLVKWVMESASMSAFAAHRTTTRFYNATEGGIGFSDIPYRPLSAILEELPLSVDVKGHLHFLYQDSRLPEETESRVQEALQHVEESLQRCAVLIENLCGELEKNRAEALTGKAILYEMEIGEELAFKFCIEPLKFAVERIKSWRLHAHEKKDLLSLEVWRHVHFRVLKMLQAFK